MYWVNKTELIGIQLENQSIKKTKEHKSKKRISRHDKINENTQEDVCKSLMQLKQEKTKSGVMFTPEKNLYRNYLKILKISCRRKLKEALSKLK